MTTPAEREKALDDLARILAGVRERLRAQWREEPAEKVRRNVA